MEVCRGLLTGFKYQGSVATHLIIRFIVTEPTDLQANCLCCLPVLHFFNSAPTPIFRCAFPHLCSLKPHFSSSSSSFSSSCSLYSSLHLFQCLSVHSLHVHLPLSIPPPTAPPLLFFQHPLLHLLTPSQRCNSTLHIHSVISRSNDMRTSMTSMCFNFYLRGGGLKSVWKRRLGYEIAHTLTARTPATTVATKKTPIVPQKSKLGSYSTADKTKVCFTPNMRESGL